MPSAPPDMRGGSYMIIKSQRSTLYAWFFILFLLLLTVLLNLTYLKEMRLHQRIYIIILYLIGLVFLFTRAFSTYYLDHTGITQKCFFITRHFDWKEFKFIKRQEMAGNGGGRTIVIRCSTAALPKSITAKELETKVFWPPSKTITIEWPNKGGEAFYQEFLSYCGGERDIRE